MTRPTTTGKAQDLITFTRSTTGTALAKISYGEELVTNGDFSSDSDWAKQVSANWTISGGKLNGANSTGWIKQNGIVENGKAYKITVDAIVSSGSFRMVTTADGSTYTSYITSSGSYVFYIRPLNALSGGFEFIGNGFTGSIDNISIKEVLYDQPDGTLQLFNHPINKPRIEYDASGNCLGLLVEEARTNLLTYSEDFAGSYWTKGTITISANNAIAPDGSASADKIVPNAINEKNHIIYTDMTSSPLDAFSLFVKPAGFDYVSLILQASANTDSMGVQFNLLTGTVVTSQNANGIIQDVGNGWYRVTVTPTTSTTFYYAVIQPNDGSAPNTSDFFRSTFTGNGSDGVYLWGAQFEAGSFPTSYIPTSGSAATRADDLASLAVSKFGYNQNQGSVVVESNFFGGTDTSALCYIGEDTSDRILLYYSNKNLSFQVKSSGALQATKSLSGQRNKAAFRYKLNDMVLAGDGSISSTDTAANLLGGTQNNIYIGSYYHNAGAHLNGHIKSIKYYPVGLSNAQLQALTV